MSMMIYLQAILFWTPFHVGSLSIRCNRTYSGHENPYSIKMNHLREAVERLGEDTNVGKETFPIDGHFPVESLPDNLQCHFLLKHRPNDGKLELGTNLIWS